MEKDYADPAGPLRETAGDSIAVCRCQHYLFLSLCPGKKEKHCQ
jgi:hypothetical protein